MYLNLIDSLIENLLKRYRNHSFKTLVKLHYFVAGDSKAAAKAPFANKLSGISNEAPIISSELLSTKDSSCMELCATKMSPKS